MKIPPVVTWRVTSRCNNDCAYCYGPDKNNTEMSMVEVKRMLKMFYEMGVRVIDLTGGEPLLRKGFEEIIVLMKEYGFEIFIDTNGDYFFEYDKLVAEAVRGIGLTVDFPDENRRYKTPGNLGRVLKILDYLMTLERRPIIRVATVVTRDNYDKLFRIGNLISKYKVDLWKLYQFIPQNKNALKNRKDLEITKSEFLEATNSLERKFSKEFKVVVSKMEDRDSCYFFVESDGRVFMPTQRGDIFEEVILGHIFDDDIFDKWRKSVSVDNFIRNTEVSRKYRFKRGQN
ncbi:MAG: radical SAM protein [Candidatus Shapirobacteria bacterium]